MSHDHNHHFHDHAHHGHEHAGDEAHALLDGALVLSGSWRQVCRPPVPAADLEARITGGLLQIAALLAEDGVIFGHIKALLRCGEAGITLSVTRQDVVDHTAVRVWPPSRPVEEWMLTVNVLSLAHTDAVTPELLETLFGPVDKI